MKNSKFLTIFKMVRISLFLGAVFFVTTSTAFASPALTPVSVTRVTENSATIIGHVSNPYKNSTVWFEFYNNANAPTSYAVQGIYGDGTFEWNLRDLNPGQTYSYRSAAMEGGATVYSPVSSFTTPVQKPASVGVLYQSQPETATKASALKVAPPVVVKKATATTTPMATNEGFTNKNSATVIGAGSDVFPQTLIGWVLLIIAILVAVLVARVIYERSEKRKKEEEHAEEKEEIE